MTRLTWNRPEDRTYETGVDRGVLFPAYNSGPGVPWNGLISVDEHVVGGEHEEYHYDGMKYMDDISSKNYQATVRAFSAPAEFGVCLGHIDVKPGFLLARQPRRPFGLSYRTMVNESGYKLHLVYNASVTPSGRAYQTLSNDPSPSIFEWVMDAVPELEISVSRPHKPTAHFVVESLKANPADLTYLENMLYGTDTTDPELMQPDELIDLFNL